MGAVIADHIVRAHLKTMARLNIGYDLLTYEGDIIRLQFWAHTFEILKAQGSVFLQTEGKLSGCWVMRIDDGAESDDEESREKVIVRSNGVARMRRQRHRQPVLEVRPAGQGLRLPPVRHPGRRPAAVGHDVEQAIRQRRRLGKRREFTTSSTRVSFTSRRSSARRCGRSVMRTKRTGRFTFHTKWLPCRTPRRRSWATSAVKTRRSLSSRCPGERVSG
jgi:hypothetical protein